MPADVYTLNRTKDLILSFIKARGPSLPVHIARDVKLSPLFAAAFLSELYGEGKLKMSALKVGSSSLYFLSDQGAQLENFIAHLNIREKEAFEHLKQEKILDDERLEPVIRVALRSIKDFAHPVRFTQNGQPRLFWRYFLLSEEDAQKEIATRLEPIAHKESPTPASPPAAPLPETAVQARSPKLARPKRATHSPAPVPAITLPLPGARSEAAEKPAVPPSPFAQAVLNHLATRAIEVLEMKESKKKEFRARVSLETPLGPQHFFLIAKDKKHLKGEELLQALQQAHAEKLPALLMARSDIEKKALSLYTEWSALLKFEKLP